MEITTKPTIQEQIEKESLDKIIKYAESLEANGVDRKKIHVVRQWDEATLLNMMSECLIFLKILEVQTVFNGPREFLPLYLLILSLFSIFSIVNCVFLIREWWR